MLRSLFLYSIEDLWYKTDCKYPSVTAKCYLYDDVALCTAMYEGVSINNQPIPFLIDRDGHDFHALFQYMFYTWVQNCTRIELFFNKMLNVKHG